MSKFLIDLIVELIRRGIKGTLIALALLNFGCKGGGAADSADSGGGGGSPGTPLDVELLSGGNFDCLIWEGKILMCRNVVGLGLQEAINFGPGGPNCSGNGGSCTGTGGQFVVVVASAAAISETLIMDDTICWTTQVAERPIARTPGVASYCIGEATLNPFGLGGQPAVFSGPSFTSAANGSSSLSYFETPFLGADATLDTMSHWSIWVDGTGSVSSQTLSCEVSADGSTLTCPSFTVGGL